MKRHEKYSRFLTSNYSEFRLLINSRKTKRVRIGNPFALFFNFFESCSYLIRQVKHIRKGDIHLLIAGDPWQTATVALLLRTLSRKKFPIEIQIHADIGNDLWIRESIRNRIKYISARFVLQFANQIRFVSEMQKRNLLERFRTGNSKTYVSPLPLTLPDLSKIKVKRGEVKSIGFVGRLHEDRGLLNVPGILEMLHLSLPELEYHFIGEGPYERLLFNELSATLAKGKITFHGSLSVQELERVWPKIGILVSLAPTESYGRAVREALVHGIPVIALRTSGISDLVEWIPAPFLLVCENILGVLEQHSNLRLLTSTIVPKRYRDELISQDSEAIPTLVENWVDAGKL